MKVVSLEKQSSRKRKIPNLHPRKPSKTEDAGLLDGVRTEHLRIYDIMVVSNSGKRYGVVSMDHQVETVSGHKPRRGPPPATGSSYPKHLAGTGQSYATGYNLRLCHWNAEGIRPKKLEIQNVLKSKTIEVCCIQETHLNSNHCFYIKGYETVRRDRESAPKGELLILVNKNHPAMKIYRSEDEDTEVLGIKLLLEGNPLSIYNLYNPEAEEEITSHFGMNSFKNFTMLSVSSEKKKGKLSNRWKHTLNFENDTCKLWKLTK